MALPTPNLGFLDSARTFSAVGFYLHPGIENKEDLPDLSSQNLMFAGVRLVDGWRRAVLTQAREPLVAQEATFLTGAATMVVAIKIGTFFTGWSSHDGDYSMQKEE